ncbi:helix-turn-helix transcriptional regulator [Thiomicrorhabdus lithotrophica]|uniref:AlpA family phage regulatory protein n=1 Tax=Thiomicrorhabdus lithotrophica TaxID=2949997 RepID=A0ABY8C8A0_9GAMM|nr:AlpA family phage regulatory protein [Thiomicrorhabdus lithotrophica]WEJ62185.1 AlpA family phage regulatory protein [Thiomicrorhabdus lithotrophica]
MQSVTMLQSDLQTLLIQAANIGAQQGIEAALKNTQTQPVVPLNVRKKIRLKQVQEITGLSESSIRRRNNPQHHLYDDTFPKPCNNGKTVMYWLDEITTWNEPQAQEA